MTASDDWTAVPGYSRYEAGYGQVRNGKGHVLKPRLSNKGYLLLNLTADDGRIRTVTVHSIILLTFAGERPPGLITRHLDDNPLNNRWAPGNADESRAAGGNLVYGTQPENERDKLANGRAAPVPPRRPDPPRPWPSRVLATVRDRLRGGDRL